MDNSRKTPLDNVIFLKDHKSKRQKEIREAEKKAEQALLAASAAFTELHRIEGDEE